MIDATYITFGEFDKAIYRTICISLTRKAAQLFSENGSYAANRAAYGVIYRIISNRLTWCYSLVFGKDRGSTGSSTGWTAHGVIHRAIRNCFTRGEAFIYSQNRGSGGSGRSGGRSSNNARW